MKPVPPLTLSEIDYAYPGTPPLFRRLSVEISKGELFGVVGPGGAGKTTLLKIMAGLLMPSGGRVETKGLSSKGALGMTFQNSGLFDGLSAGENLDLPLKESGLCPNGAERKKRIKEMLQQVGLPGIEERRIIQLSGGMRKRLAIARAVILNPELLLCDDPTAGLDPVTSRQIVEMLVGIQRNHGMTLVWVTSQLNEAMRWSNRIGFLHGGSFVQVGTPEAIGRSSDPKVRQFVRGEIDGPLSEDMGT